MSKAYMLKDEFLSGDIFVRDLISRHVQDSIILQLVLGPTPLKITDNPEEFNNEITITLAPGIPLRKLIHTLVEVDTAKTDIAAWHMATN